MPRSFVENGFRKRKWCQSGPYSFSTALAHLDEQIAGVLGQTVQDVVINIAGNFGPHPWGESVLLPLAPRARSIIDQMPHTSVIGKLKIRVLARPICWNYNDDAWLETCKAEHDDSNWNSFDPLERG